MEDFTKREIEEAKEACEAQGMLGHPTDRKFLGMVRVNMINNCDITETAVKNANTIFGPDLAGVRGRTVRRAPESLRIQYVQIPATILDWHWIVTLSVDCMFVNSLPFIVSASRGLNLLTAEYTPSRTKKESRRGYHANNGSICSGGFPSRDNSHGQRVRMPAKPRADHHYKHDSSERACPGNRMEDLSDKRAR